MKEVPHLLARFLFSLSDKNIIFPRISSFSTCILFIATPLRESHHSTTPRRGHKSPSAPAQAPVLKMTTPTAAAAAAAAVAVSVETQIVPGGELQLKVGNLIAPRTR